MDSREFAGSRGIRASQSGNGQSHRFFVCSEIDCCVQQQQQSSVELIVGGNGERDPDAAELGIGACGTLFGKRLE